MEEIKFRAWDEIDGKTRPVVSIDFLNKTVNLLNEYTNEIYARDFVDIKIMQYTGLNDEESNEIYNGYIIEGGYLNPLSNKFMSKKYIVVYDKGSFVGKLIRHTPYGDTWLHFVKGKVIGNIYENPELLEVR